MAADFTVDEIKLIKEQYPVLGISIAPQLPRHSRNAIQTKAKRLGVKRLCCVPDYALRTNDAIALAMLIDCEDVQSIYIFKFVLILYFRLRYGLQVTTIQTSQSFSVVL